MLKFKPIPRFLFQGIVGPNDYIISVVIEKIQMICIFSNKTPVNHSLLDPLLYIRHIFTYMRLGHHIANKGDELVVEVLFRYSFKLPHHRQKTIQRNAVIKILLNCDLRVADPGKGIYLRIIQKLLEKSIIIVKELVEHMRQVLSGDISEPG